jgi:hypothetical protein
MVGEALSVLDGLAFHMKTSCRSASLRVFPAAIFSIISSRVKSAMPQLHTRPKRAFFGKAFAAVFAHYCHHLD